MFKFIFWFIYLFSIFCVYMSNIVLTGLELQCRDIAVINIIGSLLCCAFSIIILIICLYYNKVSKLEYYFGLIFNMLLAIFILIYKNYMTNDKFNSCQYDIHSILNTIKILNIIESIIFLINVILINIIIYYKKHNNNYFDYIFKF